MDDSNKNVGLDNVNAGDGENKVHLGYVHNGDSFSNDDAEVDDVGGNNTNGEMMLIMVMVIANLIVVIL